MSKKFELLDGIKRVIPILGWMQGYKKSWLRADLVAGIAVAALVVPKSLGYAGIAGVPIQNGLYAAAAGSILYAIFGTTKQISTGPSSALSALVASMLLVTAINGEKDAVELVTAVTLFSGLLYLLLAIFRMGWISQFLSKAVITGFLFGAAVEVIIGELPKLTGTEISGANAWQKLWSWVGSLGEINVPTLVVGLTSLFAVALMRFGTKKLPTSLILIGAGIVFSWILDIGGMGVALVGDVPRGLVAPQIPNLELFREHISTIAIVGVGLVLIGFSQTAGDARAFATKHRYQIDINQESVAQGMANIFSGLFRGIPVSTSLSASSLNDTSGAKTQLASLTTGVAIILILIAFAPLLSGLPKPVLAALIIDAVFFGMMDFGELKRLYRVKRLDFWIAVASIVSVVLGGVLAGVIVGIILSILWLINVNAKPETSILGRKTGTTVFQSVDEYPDSETYPGILIVRFDAGLYFLTADALEDYLRKSVFLAKEPIETIILQFEGINFIDSQGASKLHELLNLAADNDIDLHFTRVKPAVKRVLVADGVVDRLGANHIHGNTNEAVSVVLSFK